MSLVLRILLFVLIGSSSLFATAYPYRKYEHIKSFYQDLTEPAIALALQYNVPPAAILAIASVESGYGRGYVARITGNILSLGAGQEEKELPALRLPTVLENGQVLYDYKKIMKYKKEELAWKERPKSLKKDYRPASIAGTPEDLAYFDYHQKAKIQAQLACIKDFVKKWISEDKPFKPFKEARAFLDAEVKKHGKEVLFTERLNQKFIEMIGGRKNSFNYRPTWPKKVKTILQKAGIVELTKAVYIDKKSFDEVW